MIKEKQKPTKNEWAKYQASLWDLVKTLKKDMCRCKTAILLCDYRKRPVDYHLNFSAKIKNGKMFECTMVITFQKFIDIQSTETFKSTFLDNASSMDPLKIVSQGGLVASVFEYALQLKELKLHTIETDCHNQLYHLGLSLADQAQACTTFLYASQFYDLDTLYRNYQVKKCIVGGMTRTVRRKGDPVSPF